ncbi:Oxygen-independent coproporphyrinogen-III oxidase [Propionibacterium australiense]|uniref:Heme chaperone HemW n=1 Tax=Propionibacterium australiense TaxID=119981 RepID=A0A383S7F0_9ACTN|nr:coproporphyrinogen oxidase [Propionibacterium australiense]VEH90956.1 Oxygen-independent coproporphyrinogen-III oxidase [Propionibacterium australiense]
MPPAGRADGPIEPGALATVPGRALSFYVHVPFCATRCGYCDFNTYTPSQLPGMTTRDYVRAAHREIDRAAQVLGGDRAVSTVFFGGGTPTTAADDELGGLLTHLRQTFGLAPDAEVTTEANPESLDERRLARLLDAGFNRLSLGMQSGDERVLATLDRRHTPGRAVQVARWAHRAGFGNVSLDLIYGAPGETIDQWRVSLETALEAAPEHVSAYSLIVEDGTALARRIAHGRLPEPDEDLEADKYLLAEELLGAAGLANYEISNWSRPGREAAHNMAYWRSDDWWGIGPGAHSHVGAARWWNVRHPRRYAAILAAGTSPRAGHEILDAQTSHEETVMLRLRLREGLGAGELTGTERARLPGLARRGLVEVRGGRVRLTLAGRLLADAVTLEILG